MLSGRGPIIMINLGETALSWDGMSAASMQQAWFPGWCHSGLGITVPAAASKPGR